MDPALDTPESWPYFKAYRDARGSRALGRIRFSVWDRGARVTATAPTMATMAEWYRRGRWAERAAAWDAHLDEITREEREIAARLTVADMEARHRQIFALQTHIITRELEKLAGEVEREDPILKPQHLVQAINSLVKEERLHYGKATERVEGIERLTDAELDYIEKKLQGEST